MNKKLICLLLSVLMLLSVVLTSCGKKSDDDVLEDITEEASAATVTLSMYLMSEAPVSAEQEAAIENALNVLTKAKYKVKMDLTFLTPDVYYTALEENLKKQSENADLYYTEENTAEPETEKDELGIETLKYPALKPNQVDIFYLSGYDKYSTYAQKDYLNLLNEEVDGDAKALKSYITPKLLEYMKSANGGIYAIPSNRAIGNYTYLLLNKDVLAATYHDVSYSDFSSLTSADVQDILAYVNASDLKNQYVPLHSFTGEIDVLNYEYWGKGSNGSLSSQFSVLGGAIDLSWEHGAQDSYPRINNIFLDEAYTSQLKVLGSYKRNGYYDAAAVANGKDFAVGYIKGNAKDVAKYSEDYEIVTVATPTLYTQDLYQDMFAVSAYTVSLSRSMDIITYLNTDEEVRNLLAYGIEGENYELVETEKNGETYKQVKLLNNSYNMDVNKTGNILLAYTTVDQDPMLREYAKEQNRDMKVAYNIGFQLDYDDMTLHEAYFEQVRVLSEQIFAEMMAKDPAEWTDEYIASLNTRVNKERCVAYMCNSTMTPDSPLGEGYYSLQAIYSVWLEDTGLYIPPVEPD